MLRFRFRMRHRNLPAAEGSGSGPAGRISKMRKLVNALVRHERIEGLQPWLDESRGYAERLIEEAVRNGDQHKPTMEKADYWLRDKDLVHKLFKVLVPRYQSSKLSYTQMWNLPTVYPGRGYKMSILELRDNPWPDVVSKQRRQNNSLINILLREAQLNYQKHAPEESPSQSIDPEHVVKDKHMDITNHSTPSEMVHSETAENLESSK